MKKLESILLVDDDETQNFVNERLLQKLALANNILIAQNGKAALELIEELIRSEHQEELPKLIFLDMNMPVLNGLGFLQAFETLNFPGKEAVIIVMLTSSSNIKDRQAISQTSVKEFISKPLTKTYVTELVSKYF